MNPLLDFEKETGPGGVFQDMPTGPEPDPTKALMGAASSVGGLLAGMRETSAGSLRRAWEGSVLRDKLQEGLDTAAYYAGPHLSNRVEAVASIIPSVTPKFGTEDARAAEEAFKAGHVGRGAGLMGLGVAGGLLDAIPGQGALKGLLKGVTKAAHYMPDLSMAAAPIKAFHGSPHDFDKFDIKKIGAGEGAQTYGHGLYFAGKEDVARQYRDALAPKAADPSGASNMYEVNIHADPEKLLDWDRPLREQPKVMEALDPILPKTISGLRPGSMVSPVTRGGAVKGETAWQDLAGQQSPAGAAQMLKEAGIPGIQYLDAGSRHSAGEQTRNYVTFSDDIVEILRKYGLAGAGVGLGGSMAMQPGLFPLPQQQ